MLHRRGLAALLALVALLGAACGDDGNEDTTTDTEPTTTTAEDGADEEASPDDDAPAQDPDVQVGETSLGDVLVDAEGRTLYAFTQDSDGAPTCTADCAATWPPALVEAEPVVGEGVDPAVISTVEGAEGGTQIVADGWPLYTFSGDAAAGDVNGQEVGGVWFAVSPDGSLMNGSQGGAGSQGGDGGGTSEGPRY